MTETLRQFFKQRPTAVVVVSLAVVLLTAIASIAVPNDFHASFRRSSLSVESKENHKLSFQGPELLSASPARKTQEVSALSESATNSSKKPAASNITYAPGKLTVNQLGLRLSTGLQARLLVTSGKRVTYKNGTKSSIRFHSDPDFGATFKDPRPNNKGGWIYVSNCEDSDEGGVGALTFDSKGDIIDYKMVLKGTRKNCGGGQTPWGSWISCEEHSDGKNWQVDPTGEVKARPITLGRDGGKFESFAYDIRKSHYFVTEDRSDGPLRRFIPANKTVPANETILPANDNPWEELHGPGKTTYLRLIPETDGKGTFKWIQSKKRAKDNAESFYPNSEGIDVHKNQLYFVSKKIKTLFILNLDNGRYTSHTTRKGVFDGQPDQIERVIGAGDDLLYFTEDGGDLAGVHARDKSGRFFTILESHRYTDDETTGLAFSPDGKHLYVAYQDHGKLFDITRKDGRSFHARSLNIKYHATNAD